MTRRITRRILVRWVLSFLAVVPFRRVRLFAQVRSLEEADIATLTDLAEAALPSSLGREGAEATVQSFVRWLAATGLPPR